MTTTAEATTLSGRLASQWWDVVYLMTGFLLAIAQSTVAILVVTGALTAPIAGVGLILLIPGLWAARWLAVLDRSRASLVGPVIPAPMTTPRSGWRFLVDPVAWRGTAYHALHGLWAFVAGLCAVVFLSAPASNYVNGQIIYVDGGMSAVL